MPCDAVPPHSRVARISAPQKRKIVVIPQNPYSHAIPAAPGNVAMYRPPAADVTSEAVSNTRAEKRSARAPPGKYPSIAVTP